MTLDAKMNEEKIIRKGKNQVMIYKKTMYKKRASYQGRLGSGARCECALPAYDVGYLARLELSERYPSLAMVYGINQNWREIDDSCVGFERGTIFNELNKPFMGDKCKNGGYCK